MKRILVVDDHKVNRVLISTILNKFELSHDLAENGKVALDMVEYVQYDLILMDIFMPVMNGFEALDIIKNHKIGTISKIPVIAVTGKPQLAGINKFDAVIPKPVKIGYFRDVIEAFICLGKEWENRFSRGE